MDRTLLVSGSLAVFIGALGLVSGCDTGTGSTTTGTATESSSGAAGTGGTAGMGGSAGAAGMAGAGGMAASSSSSSTSSSSTTTSSSGMAGAGGSGGTGGAGGMAGAGGMGGAGGMAGAGGMGGSGGSVGLMACKACDATGKCVEPCVPSKPDDMDCDGWTIAEGDCCDNCFKCGSPASVNPGAFEYLGNGSDDDCDPTSLDNQPPTDCTDAPLATPTSTIELVKAMDLCQFTAENPPLLAQKKWGVISSALLLADGTNVVLPKDLQVGVLSEYGPYVKPIKGATLAALSTGTARDETDPGHKYPQNGPNPLVQKGNFDATTAVPIPADYLIHHGGVLPQGKDAMGNACPACSGANCTTAFDSVNFKMRIRVPTNAKSFSYRLKSYSAEYPEYTCGQFNDFFITRLKTGWLPDPNNPDPLDPKNQPLPLDRNIAFDAFKNPISVNNAFYDVCFPYIGAPADACSSGTLELFGTGMGGWNGDLKDGGGTVWLFSEANVVPGETIEIEFIIFDAGDHNVDSIVLLDYFRWGLQPTAAGVHK